MSKTVFISYSHDSDEHRDRVLALSERLREDGITTLLDQYVNGSPAEGWPRWMLNQLDEADSVLVVCTETYYRRFRGREEPGKGKGADWEGALITQEIYDSRSTTLKFVPVLFAPEDGPFIPEPLRKDTYYVLNSEAAYGNLYDFLLGQSGVQPRPVGAPRTRERRRGVALRFPEPSENAEPQEPTDANERTGLVEAYTDKTVRKVALALEEENPLTMRALVRNLDVLFNRGTFRFEPLRECFTQEWGRRLLPAVETLELLRSYSGFVSDQASDDRTYEKLMDEVNGYCVAMATYLFQETVRLSEMRDYVGTREFLTRLPVGRRWRSADAIDDETNTRVDGPRIRSVRQMDRLRKEFVKASERSESKS